MKCVRSILFVCLLIFSVSLSAQTATITGIVFDQENKALSGVNIRYGDLGTFTDANGYYLLQLPAEQELNITFSHIGHQEVVIERLLLNTNEIFGFNPILKTDITQIDGVTVTPQGEKKLTNILQLTPQVIRNIPGANAGVENILKLLPGVSSNNELSTQYAVRGGNYDENLVYINEIEVYRPFLIRSAQQEGLGIVNSALIKKVEFSAGGFQARHGDKLSSVLDITYKNPIDFNIDIDASLMGGSLAVETSSKNKKLATITGARYRNNALLLGSLDTQSNLNPVFADLQHYSTYRFSPRFHLDFLGVLSLNDYRNKPLNRRTNFGTLSEPKALLVDFEGNENNEYKTALGALKANFYANNDLTLKLIGSLYHTIEKERSDVIATYELGAIDTDLGSGTLGDVTSVRGLGSQFNRARNTLDALIFKVGHKGSLSRNGALLEWGMHFSHEDIRDQLRESEFIDSAGYSVRPPRPEFVNQQPEIPFEAALEPWTGVAAKNLVKTNRISAFAQYSEHTQMGKSDVYYNLGLRTQRWTTSGQGIAKVTQHLLSPRLQLAVKPHWKNDVVFKLALGRYVQPPFYRELRDAAGTVQPSVKAQKATHFVLGSQYSFLLWNRPFTLLGEAYFKDIDDVNPYTIEDLRIRYAANNNAKAYTYGVETRLNGAFVPGTESWVSIGYLRAQENINERGTISRPSDQRFKFGILFQDYVPDIPNLKMYLNLVYNTGVPGGSPNYADPYVFQNRLKDYKRADLGISHIFVNEKNKFAEGHWLHNFKEFGVGIEVFNLFNNKNSITNTWVRDVDNKQEFAIPNFLTGRILNIRLKMRL